MSLYHTHTQFTCSLNTPDVTLFGGFDEFSLINNNMVFTVHQNTHLTVSRMKRVKKVKIPFCLLSHDVVSGSEITPCNKIDKPLVVYRFTGNVMSSIIKLRT